MVRNINEESLNGDLLVSNLLANIRGGQVLLSGTVLSATFFEKLSDLTFLSEPRSNLTSFQSSNLIFHMISRGNSVSKLLC